MMFISKSSFSLHRRNIAAFCFASLSSSGSDVRALHVAIITGTTRINRGPPQPVLGPRVASLLKTSLERRSHQVSVVTPQDVPDLLERAHFSYAASQVPDNLKKVHETLQSANAYVAITPEYNHAPSPGLVNILNHFGSSVFSFKPSAIVSYSAGQWGGTRAAMGMRPILSELGCLPVSAMIHIPKAESAIHEDGTPKEDEERWNEYVDRCLSQLEWWAEAAVAQREVKDPFAASPAFRSNPKQRNAP